MSGNKLRKTTSAQTSSLSIVRYELKATVKSFTEEKNDERSKCGEKAFIQSKGYIRPPKHDFL